MYAEVNVVSLIDLMMLLMVIFMITAPIMQGGVDLELPRADARAVESRGGMTISIDRTGTIFVDGTRMSAAEFRAHVRTFAARRADDGVYVQADRSGRVEYLVQVMGVLRAAGIANVAIIAEPEDARR